MRASITRAPAEAQNRLDRARLALRLAEERTGLRDSAALTVQRALSSASTSALLSASADSPQAGSSASPAPPTVLSACQDSGVLTLHGSTTLLLAALALRQGATGWCGVIGGDELGWCAATEVGLDLNRVLTIPAPLLDDASTLTVTSTLLDGVDTLLIGATIAEGLRPQHRRRLLSRARERGHLILTPARWEGARILQAAGTLMAQSGFAATPSKAIAALAAVDLASINYHFGGREGLLQATLAEAHRHFISEEDLRALADGAQPASEKLRALLALLAKNCVNASSWHGRALARELGNPSPQLLQMLQAQVPQKARPVLRILSEVSGIPPHEPALLRCAVSTVAPLIMLTVSAIGIPGPAQAVREMPHEVIAEHMYRFALAGLQAVGQAWAQAGGKK